MLDQYLIIHKSILPEYYEKVIEARRLLEDGKIMEQGSHDELLKNKRGSYSRLWSRQSGAFLNKETDEVAQIEE